MKNIFKKAILPLLVFGIAIASVFATNSNVMVVDQPSQPIHTGVFLYKDAMGNCLRVILDAETMDCTLVNTDVKCTWGTLDLFDGIHDTETEKWICVAPLSKRTVP